MRKFEIKIVKAQDGLPEGTVKSVEKRVAVDLVDRQIAEFVNPEDQEQIEQRKADNAEKANEARKINKKKVATRTAPDDKRQKDQEEAAKKTQDTQLKMLLGRRKQLLDPFSAFIDLESEEFNLTVETTKEQFQIMQDAAKQAKADHESAIVTEANNPKKEAVEASETKKGSKVPKGSKK